MQMDESSIFNKAAQRLFGYTEDEVVRRGLSLIVPPQLRENREDYLKHFLRTEIQRLIGHEGEVPARHREKHQDIGQRRRQDQGNRSESLLT